VILNIIPIALGDPVLTHFDIRREWFELPSKKGREREESIARLEEFLKKREKVVTT